MLDYATLLIPRLFSPHWFRQMLISLAAAMAPLCYAMPLMPPMLCAAADITLHAIC